MTMLNNFKVLWKHRELLWVWAGREVRVRYKQSFLGAGWAVLQPLALTLMFSVVFTFVVRVPTGGVPYPIFSYTAMLPWTFLASSISFGVPSLVSNMNLVTKIYFPREVLPMAAIAAAGVDFLVAGLIFVGMIFWYRIPIYPTALLLPVLLLIQIVLTFGVALIGAAALVFSAMYGSWFLCSCSSGCMPHRSSIRLVWCRSAGRICIFLIRWPACLKHIARFCSLASGRTGLRLPRRR